MMNKKEFIKWEKEVKDTVDFKTIYVDVAGDLIAGLILSQIIYWHLPDKKGANTRLRVWKKGDEKKKIEASYWLAKRYADWYSECRVREKRAENAIKRLVERGIIETRIYKFSGSPTTHIRIVWDSFLEKLEIEIQSRESLKGQNDEEEINEILVDSVNITKESSQNDVVPGQNGQIELDKTVDSLTETTTVSTRENISKNKDSLRNESNQESSTFKNDESVFPAVVAEDSGLATADSKNSGVKPITDKQKDVALKSDTRFQSKFLNTHGLEEFPSKDDKKAIERIERKLGDRIADNFGLIERSFEIAADVRSAIVWMARRENIRVSGVTYRSKDGEEIEY